MSSQIELIAIISPKAGKVDRVSSLDILPLICTYNPQVVELLNEVSKYVHNNEPGTLKYQIIRELNKKTGVEQIIMMER